MFTQSYQWRRSQTHCDQTYISNQSPKIPMNNDTLKCVTNSSNFCGNYTPLSVNGYCTDFSTLIDSSSSQISVTENIIMGSIFCVAYQGSIWPGLQSPSCNYSCYIDIAKWSLACCIDLRVRLDGIINTPPVPAVISPIRIPVNSLNNITIPVTDADNDVIRCRWAQSTSILDECGDICGIVSGSVLDTDSCTLTFDSTGKTAGDVYAIALMVEDFYNTSSNTALSSVPAQFLIQIVDTSTCLSKPIISSNLSANTNILVGNSFSFTLTIQPGCSGVTIVDLFRTPPLNMRKSNITVDTATNMSLVTETWTPTVNQVGSQVYCAMATDSASVQSDLYCLTFKIFLVALSTTIIAPITVPDVSTVSEMPTTFDITTDTTTSSTTSTSTSSSSESTTTTSTTSSTSESTTTTSTTSSSSTSSTSESTTTTTTTSSTSSTSTSTATTTTTTSTTSTSVSTSTTSTTSSTSTSTTSTATTTTTTSSSSSSSTTSATTSTSTTSTTTTTTAQESITITVLVPVSSKDNSQILGLALGLGLPLLLLLAGLAVYGCFRDKCMSPSDLYRRLFKRSESADKQVKPTENFSDYKDDNHSFEGGFPDYRQQYIKDGNDDQTNNHSILINEEGPLTQENSFASMSISDFELNPLNVTTTSFYSPSMNSLPYDNVQHIQETSSKTIKSKQNASVLVRAYSEQEKNRPENTQ